MTVLAILAASLLGSVHCAAMCGPFVLLYAGQPAGHGAWKAHAAYNLARLTAYVTLGAAAGLLGAGMDHAGETFLGVQRVAAIAMAAVIVGMAVVPLLRRKTTAAGRPGPIARLRALAIRKRRPGPGPAAAVGLLSGLLPCGWLWSFVALAAASGSAAAGALTMATFWAGTVPALVGVGWLLRKLSLPVRKHAPLFSAVAILLAGGIALFGKLPVAPDVPPACHAPIHLPVTP
jgi:sulfite exporter TauE/SafE